MNTQKIRIDKLQHRLHSALLIMGMTALMAMTGWVLGGKAGSYFALGICVAAILFGPDVSPSLVLRWYRARQLTRRDAPGLFELMSSLARRSRLTRLPELYLVPSKTPNALALGGDRNSAIAITTGLLQMLDGRELEGVLAHEISHIRHRDPSVMGLAALVSRVTAGLSQIGQIVLLLGLPILLLGGSLGISFAGLLFLIFAPLVSNLLQLALSRQRETIADMGALELTGDAHGLASALRKLESFQSRGWWRWLLLPGRHPPQPAWFRSHPLTAERIEQLMHYASQHSPDPTIDRHAFFV